MNCFHRLSDRDFLRTYHLSGEIYYYLSVYAYICTRILTRRVHMDENRINKGNNVPGDDGAVREARHVTWVGFWVNAVLGLAKVLGGIFGRSSALVADGIHSFSDFLSDIIVIIMVGVAHKRPDTDHQFGHGRYEALATILLSIALMAVAVGILVDSIDRIILLYHGGILPRPANLTLFIIVVSILSKEWLFRYTRRVGVRIHSDAVIANAWHHRSDAFSSIATLIGVAGAMFLGEKWRVLDPAAALIVSVIIGVVGVKMMYPALGELLGRSLPENDCREIENAIRETAGVKGWHRLRTFKSGNDAYVEVHIKVDPEMNVREAHNIATVTEENIKNALPGMSVYVTTHIEPAKD